MLDGPDRGRRATVHGGAARIGTAESCDLRLTDRTASRVHCEIRVKPRAVLVRDAGSTNGTTCEGIRVVEAEVPAGAVLRIGASAVRIEISDDWAALLPVAARGASAPRVAIWHGDADWVVRPANAEALVCQWTAASGVAEAPSSTETFGPARHDVYQDARGVVRVERWLVKGTGHGVVLDPKSGCGRAGAYLLDEGLCSTRRSAVFFGLVDEDGSPTTRPPSGLAGSEGAASPGASTGGDDCD